MPEPISVQIIIDITLLHHHVQTSDLESLLDIVLLYHESFHLVLQCPYLGHQIARLVRGDAYTKFSLFPFPTAVAHLKGVPEGDILALITARLTPHARPRAVFEGTYT